MWHQTMIKNDTKISLLMFWEYVVEEYRGRHLILDKGRLVAIYGLTRQFEELELGNFLAGLWQSALHKEKLWRSGYTNQREYDVRSRLYEVPSWSWASMRGFCRFPFPFEYHRRRHCMVQILRVEATGQVYDTNFMLRTNFADSLGGKDEVETLRRVSNSGFTGASVPKGYLTIPGRYAEATAIKFDEEVAIKTDSLLRIDSNGYSNILPFRQDDTSDTSNGDRAMCILWSVAPDKLRPRTSKILGDNKRASYFLVLSRFGTSSIYKCVGISFST